MEGVERGRRWKRGRRKSGAEGAQLVGNLPKRHPRRGVQTPKKPAKTGLSAAKIGWEIGKLSVRENRRSKEYNHLIKRESLVDAGSEIRLGQPFTDGPLVSPLASLIRMLSHLSSPGRTTQDRLTQNVVIVPFAWSFRVCSAFSRPL